MLASSIFYFGLSLVTALLAELSVKAKTHKRIVAFISMFIPSFFSGIRYGIGTDYYVTYKPFYDYLSGRSNLTITRSSLDIGYDTINRVVIFFGGGFPLVLFISAFITFYALRKGLLLNSDKCSIGLGTFIFMLMYYQPSFNIVRQVLASTIVLYSLNFIVSKEAKKFIGFVLIAALFHKTAIVVLPFYIIVNILTDRKHKFIGILVYILFFCAVFNFDSFAPLVDLIDYTGRYSSYLRKVSDFSFSFGLLIRTVPYMVSVYLMLPIIKKDERIKIYLNFFLLGSILRLIVYMTQFDADRIALYFLMPQVYFIPYLVKNYKKNWRFFGGSCILIGTTIMLWWFDYILMGRNATIPYTTIFS